MKGSLFSANSEKCVILVPWANERSMIVSHWTCIILRRAEMHNAGEFAK